MKIKQIINQINWDLIKHKLAYSSLCRWFGHNYSIKRLKGVQCSRCGRYKSYYIDEDSLLR